jgi:hypothetical protein
VASVTGPMTGRYAQVTGLTKCRFSTSKDRLRGNEVLPGEAGQFGRGSYHQWPPRWPMLEVGDRMAGEIRPQHVSHCLRVEQAARRDQGTQLSGRSGLSAAKGPIEPDDHALMLRAAAQIAALKYVTRSRACDGRHLSPGMEGQLAIMCDVADGRYVRCTHLLLGMTWITECDPLIRDGRASSRR